MSAFVASARGEPTYRYVLTRVSSRGPRAAEFVADVTARVVKVGTLDEQLEEMPGVACLSSLTLELVPDETLAPDGPVFSARAADADVRLDVIARYAGGEEDKAFAGVLAQEPEYREDLEERTLVVRFVDRLAAAWDDEPRALEKDGEELAWAHVADALLPALLAEAAEPPRRVNVDLPRLAAAEPFWSYYGDPAAEPDVRRRVQERAKGLAWDGARKLLYVGVGPYIRSFDPARRRWSFVARVAYKGTTHGVRELAWRVAHLEYDAASGRLLGVAETTVDDVAERSAHLKALFAVDL